MRHQPPATAPEPSKPRAGRLLHPRRWLQKRHPAGEDDLAFAFGIRLFATVAVAFTVVGFVAYVLLERTWRSARSATTRVPSRQM